MAGAVTERAAAMPVKRRLIKTRKALTPAQEAFLRDEPCPEGVEYVIELEHDLLTLPWRGDGLNVSGEALWADYGAQATKEWVQLHPGTRPRPWWRYSAPEPRQRLGGTGDPTKEALGLKSLLVRGVPLQWLDDIAVGNRTEPGHPGRITNRPLIRGIALDPEDPPMFESEAAYLDRLQLWLAGERERVPADAFRPESVLDILN